MTVAIATGLTPNPASGNTTTDGTLQTFASGSTAGTYQLALNTSNMASGDSIAVTISGKANGSDSTTVIWQRTFANAQSEPLKVSPPEGCTSGYLVQVQRLSGTDRAYQWAVRNYG